MFLHDRWNRFPALFGLSFLVLFLSIPALAATKKSSGIADSQSRHTFSAQTSGSQETGIKSTPDSPQLALASELLGSAMTRGTYQTQGATKENWEKELRKAQGDRTTGVTLFVVGLIGGTALTYAGGLSSSAPLILVGGLGGTALTIYGIVVWVQAANEIDNLKTEGRIKGYMSSLSDRSGTRLSLAIPF